MKTDELFAIREKVKDILGHMHPDLANLKANQIMGLFEKEIQELETELDRACAALDAYQSLNTYKNPRWNELKNL